MRLHNTHTIHTMRHTIHKYPILETDNSWSVLLINDYSSKRDYKFSFKWHSMQKETCGINNGTLLLYAGSLAPDPIRVLSCVRSVFWTNRNGNIYSLSIYLSVQLEIWILEWARYEWMQIFTSTQTKTLENFNNVEDIVVFTWLKVFNSDYSKLFSCSRNVQVTFVTTIENNLFI